MKDKDLLKILKKTAGKWSGYTAATMFFRGERTLRCSLSTVKMFPQAC